MTKDQFKSLFDDYFEAVRNYIYYRCGESELATDIVQETFVKIWEKQIEYREKQTKSLLYKMATDLLTDHFRKKQVAADHVKTLEFHPKENSSEETLHYNELKSNYEKALSDLPEKQRTVFLMSRMEELSYREIAERLSLSIKAVEKRMSLALRFIRNELKVYEHKQLPNE